MLKTDSADNLRKQPNQCNYLLKNKLITTCFTVNEIESRKEK